MFEGEVCRRDNEDETRDGKGSAEVDRGEEGEGRHRPSKGPRGSQGREEGS